MTDRIYVALGQNVFVKEIEKELKKGAWIVPDSLDVDFTFGEVISCGEGYFDKGTFIPTNVKVGDKIAFPKISGTKVNFNGQKLIRVYMQDIVAKEVEGKILEDNNNE